jgi:fructosamine-3-kinase
MLPDQVIQWCKSQGFGEITSVRPVGGGCINNGARLQTMSGSSFFLKTNSDAPADMFVCEAEGLVALRNGHGPRLPQPYIAGEDYLLMEDLAPAPRRGDYWQECGHSLASLHNRTQPRFGFDHDNYIGSTPQENTWTGDGYAFFAQRRLGFQARLARQKGLLRKDEEEAVEKLCRRLPELVPAQPASLVHGDLWSGNLISDQDGAPALIDPAAHYGWAEAELAMTSLFGSFPEAFYQAYQEVRPLEKGYRERFLIYNLYHLLNHLNLFGFGYLGEVVAILRRYS